ncbi:molybdenum cofactor guanylyltransferase MobA [Entomomonas asaccharolytica]|uniref:Molybdenum cofactor guanylyltransferase n=1 Tax=Entomomonas asaccharolytica TaxID=2785331 RepID=A0A974NH74_9GAMM|nr:molybdenum cofactor guanylyltransferase MobA [Entomomonas asaccharolytica]QQP86775.1 molybdenum cofactor guanylyltransferase [Entomomonas asaccharolytica]
MINTAYKIIGLILAGGQGQRVGRQNKGLLKLQGKPLVQHVFDNLSAQVDEVVISANEDIKSYQTLVKSVFTDNPCWQGKGPLAGIISASQVLPKNIDAIQVVPCDTPFLPSDLIAQLAKALFSDPQNEIAYAATKDCIHPSIFLCKPYINAKLADHLANQKYSLKSWIFSHHAVEVFFEDEHAFTNINHLETLASFQ